MYASYFFAWHWFVSDIESAAKEKVEVEASSNATQRRFIVVPFVSLFFL
ncbi:hypothetical protein VCRA2119O147_460012 [Vibrio crassostreae]|uniref:Uncharacterized protein n=2 Tax=Vibrio TaxID=662 RepID=A0A0T7E5W4_9VIBR|nr:hypothetical protein VCRA2113O206_100030 [Vibrio crassostreae]CDT00998.1 hypothetical protein VCR1J2_20012 [Vibrio coralliirubri]CAK1696714.1 hypothetical protein VCRA2110O178_100050 [Vibrio crassostreae]CAK1701016.1 hypothetical protein VCRA2113O204_100101 [Vibrio crassostreae]CAK1702899.1 hypothetical protein VCRA2113O201_100101 [Vibrio crassostreae]